MRQSGGGGRSISLIVAMDQQGLIGRDGDLPWRLPNDLKHFKQVTMGKTILMGRRTWDSLGRALPGRPNWVVSRRADYAPEGARLFDSLDAAMQAHSDGELMIIGGADLYRQALPFADRLYLTRVLASIPSAISGDVHFPEFDAQAFSEISRESFSADDRHAYGYEFVTLDRN